MFDMGFEPQVMKIVTNVRPDSQRVLFSATFPRAMEALARKILKRPLEITVGGKSVVTSSVSQVVEVVPDDSTKFLRLLDLLGRWFADSSHDKTATGMPVAIHGSGGGDPAALEAPRILIFVDRQESADDLLGMLYKRGYVCNALHGGKDQADRDSTISDFKAGVFPILIATSVASRGLDVKGLTLVVNYDAPNHREDYVHRVGRTGRAGATGTAVTYVTPDQERYAGDLVTALEQSSAAVPPELRAMAESYTRKVAEGKAVRASMGFGGKGLEKLDKDREGMLIAQKAAMGIVVEPADDGGAGSDRDDDNDGAAAALGGGGDGTGDDGTTTVPDRIGDIVLPPTIRKTADPGAPPAAPLSENATAAERARAIALRFAAAGAAGSAAAAAAAAGGDGTADGDPAAVVAPLMNFTCEFVINDFPQKARWRVTNKEQISQIQELSGAALTTRGTFFAPGKIPRESAGERKLYLFIEGETQIAVDKAKMEIARMLREATVATVESELKRGPGGGGGAGGGGGGTGRYSVV
ncbi:P-loop containing nucleoside triphosphate hydrolase protein [Blastocladiella britannica]|nr:P-loop containing nucleoside triphosphate hydrolase protein [Blastocladiella britannica]